MTAPDAPLLEASGVAKRFGAVVALRDASLTVRPGEVVALMGANGAGKSTFVKIITGALKPSAGHVRIRGVERTVGSPAEARASGLVPVYQEPSLIPDLDTAANLRLTGTDRDAFEHWVGELGIADLDYAEPIAALPLATLRVLDLARALAAEPDVLLLDEPLSALDLKLRQHMRTELRAIQERVGITFVYITHDQGEALTMSDHVAVMSEGRIEQVGDGTTVYDSPDTAFVASFVGENNVIEGTVRESGGGSALVDTPHGPIRARTSANAARATLATGDAAMVFVRPESVAVLGPGDETENRVRGSVSHRHFEGTLWHVEVAPERGGPDITLSTLNDGRVGERPVGEAVTLGFPERLAIALPRGRLAAE